MNEDLPYSVPPPGEAANRSRTPTELAQLAALRNQTEAKAKRKDAARTRWALLNAFTDSGMAKLKPSDGCVWFALFRNAKADGSVSVGRARLSELTGLARNTVTASLPRLIKAGWLVRVRRGGPKAGVGVYKVQKPGSEGG